MRSLRIIRALLVLSAALILIGCGHTGRDLSPEIQVHTLKNGLDVYLLEDHSAPIFTFQYWAKVGSADEQEGTPGITGLSHFFEHLMFKGTEKHPDYFKAVSSKGGKLNAFTWLDVTVYWEKLAKKDLEFVLDLESDRLKHMKVDFLNVEPEREVVKSERLMRTENSASGLLGEVVTATLFDKHSYHWPTVGWMRDLNAITIEQAEAYHKRFYAPNNAYIVLVGDFQTNEAIALVEKYYGGFESRPLTREPRTTDGPLTRERRVYVEKPTGTGLMQIAYRAPAGASDDFVALEVVNELLVGGKTSRLQKALVHGDTPIAKSVGAFVFPFRDPSLLQFDVTMLPERANRAAEDIVTAEIARLIEGGVPADELARAVAQLRASVVRGMTTTQSRAQMMGFAIRASEDPSLPWKRLEQYGEISSADVVAAARKYLDPSQRVIGHAVDPVDVVKLTERWLALFPTTEPLDKAVSQAVELAHRRMKYAKDAESVAMEATAIRLLEERGQRAKKKLSGADLEAYDKYMTGGSKGPVKRTEKLTQRRAALQKADEGLAALHAGLVEKRKEMNETEATKPRLRLLDSLLERSQPGKEMVAATGDGAIQWGLHRLIEQLYHRKPAQTLLPTLKSAQAALKGDKAELLQDLIDFAHTAQSVDMGSL